MSQHDAKRLKTDDAEYELIYWPGIPGRGEFVRLLFEESGTPYKDTGKGKSDDAIGKVTSLTSASNKGDAANPPAFAPPALSHNGVLIHQTANIMMYLAPKLGLAPTDDLAAQYHLNAIALTLLDGFSDEVHETHHPVGTAMYYEDQKPEAKKRAKSYTEERLPKFLAYVQRVLDGEKSGEGPWLYGGEVSYVDLVLFQGIDGTQFAFPKATEKARKSGKYDGVFKLYDAVKERPNIKAYLESDRRAPYSDGIWRHYPELEE